MSLTGELRKPGSPVTGLVTFAAALVAGAKRGQPLEQPFKRLLELDSLPTQVLVPPVDGADGGVVGAASDYRLRYHLGPSTSQRFIARAGAAYVAGTRGSAASQLEWFFANLDELTASLRPAGRHLDDSDEWLICRYCVVLGLLEAVFRTGGAWVPKLPGWHGSRSAPDAEPLLALAVDAAVRDVANLSRAPETAFGPLIAIANNGTVAFHPNPFFAGSAGIGGADADFVIGDTLFELKTSRKFDATAVRQGLLQLVGYCLLDYDDTYRMRNVGLYFSRFGLGEGVATVDHRVPAGAGHPADRGAA